MRKTTILTIFGILAVLALMAPAAFAQCEANVPAQIYLGDPPTCIQICSDDFFYDAIELIGNRDGIESVPVLIFGTGCNPLDTDCNNAGCTPIEVPELIFNGNPYYPNQWYGINDCVEIYLYWGHDAIWWLEIWPITCDGCFCITFDSQLPVNMRSDLAAIGGNGEVALTWATASESGNDHFDIERDARLLTQVEGQGTSASGHSYRWVDDQVENGVRYTYDLYAVSVSGQREHVGRAEATPNFSSAPVTEYKLEQNYPNPFNPVTSIVFDIVEPTNVVLKIYNPMGEEVATLVNGHVNSGQHSVLFDGRNLTSGLYFYTLSAGDHFTATRKMLLVK
ncbi:MAG: T9SS type A sorting domain-containing protein [Calditrichota bacterium]